MKKTMKAAVLHKIGDKLRIEQVPIPAPGRGDVLIRVTACGVCHSDLHAVDGDWQPLPPALIPGTIKPYPRSASVTDLKSAMPWACRGCSACGSAEFCAAGMETICKAGEASGYTKPGGYAEYGGGRRLCRACRRTPTSTSWR
jgi:propanol-preferring alcohol dehydrogenase